MAKPEIHQPDLLRPDLGYEPQLLQPFDYYYELGLTRVSWIKFVAPQLEIDASQYILGELLGKLEGDDNYFVLGSRWKNKPEANIVRDQLMGRIQWKLEIAETPDEINQRLSAARESLANLDWSDDSGYLTAKKTWDGVREFVTRERKRRSNWNEAVKYSFEADEIGKPYCLPYYWEAFTTGVEPPIELYT